MLVATSSNPSVISLILLHQLLYNIESQRDINGKGYNTKSEEHWALNMTIIMDVNIHREGKVPVHPLLFTDRSPGLNSRENFVLFFLCFLLRFRMDSGMLFFRLAPTPPLWEEAVELADDVRELQHSRRLEKKSSNLRHNNGIWGQFGKTQSKDAKN